MFQSLHFIISSPYAARKILSLAIVLLYMYREVPLLFPKFHFIICVHISSVYKDLILKGSYQNSLFRLAFLDPYIRSSSSCPSQSCLPAVRGSHWSRTTCRVSVGRMRQGQRLSCSLLGLLRRSQGTAHIRAHRVSAKEIMKCVDKGAVFTCILQFRTVHPAELLTNPSPSINNKY